MERLSRPLELTTDRLSIREMNPAQAEHWFDFYRQDQIRRFLPDRFASPEEMRDALVWLVGNYSMRLSEIIRITLAVHWRESPEPPVGWVSYGPLPADESKREIAYAVHPRWMGRGIATEAGARFLAWIDDLFVAPAVYASVDRENRASLRVAQKLGFEPTVHGEEPLGSDSPGHLVLVRFPDVRFHETTPRT